MILNMLSPVAYVRSALWMSVHLANVPKQYDNKSVVR